MFVGAKMWKNIHFPNAFIWAYFILKQFYFVRKIIGQYKNALVKQVQKRVLY